MPVSLNQSHGEIKSFYNRSVSQITDLALSFFNILVIFTENVVLVYIVLITNRTFITLLNQFSSCSIIHLWNFVTRLFHFRLLTSFLVIFSGNFDLLMLCGDSELNPGPNLNPVMASQFVTGISIA